ncbi:MAG: trypsin-like peptidase domain-containing protein [Candidatus Hydrogenedentes bacterium]|nr:trypsin-like peptidase domain-containing protein [Candidatus Hydrogenedentota bacterium]
MPARAVSITLLALIASAAVQGQPAIDSGRRNAIVKAIESVAPAVVTINVVEIQRQRVVDPFFSEFFGLFDVPRSRSQERAVESIGTGFLFDQQGHIFTNYHVLQDADAISSVTLADGRQLEVEFAGADERTDIAVLRAKGTELPFIPMGTAEDLMIGEWVIAIGNPFRTMIEDPQPSVSVGVVSANHRRVSRTVADGDRLYQDLIQTDAAINPGNSGGPLVNALGQVVGINTMIFSNTGGYQGLGFAIPIDRARRVAAEIIEFGRRREPWMGFRGEALDEIEAYSRQRLGLHAERGVLVTEILRTSPAYDAGLQLGDVILEINGKQVTHPREIDFINWDLFIGDPVKLVVDRQGQQVALRFKIAEIAR